MNGGSGNGCGRSSGERGGVKRSWIIGGGGLSMVCITSPTDKALSLTISRLVLETIWVDFVLKSPLQVGVELTDLTVVVKEAGKTETNEPQEGLVEVEEIDNVSLAPGEQRTVGGFLCTTYLVPILLTCQPQDPNPRRIPSTDETCAHRAHL